jgi:hypothetical protein
VSPISLAPHERSLIFQIQNLHLTSCLCLAFWHVYAISQVDDIFAFVDEDSNGELDRVECRVLFYLLAEGPLHQVIYNITCRVLQFSVGINTDVCVQFTH